jgi:hypothetical protein
VRLRQAILALCAAAPSLACAPVPGEGRFVRIESEEALIIWDEAAQRQHFIHRASFENDAKDFGFLVPTPGKPELAAADDRAFQALAALTAPGVTVLEQKLLAGYEATVLEAADPRALDGWLRTNGYPSSPGLVEWAKPYVERKWKITAFKVAGGSPKVATGAVRLSFQTARPFFPYREPPAAGTRERMLRIYFLADARFRGTVGDYEPWAGAAVWSGSVDRTQLEELLKLVRLPPLAGGGGRRLTEFEDRSSPRPGGGELYFERAADQSTLARPAAQRLSGASGTMIALLALAILVLIGGSWFLIRRNRG